MNKSKRGLLAGFVAVLWLLVANSFAFGQTKTIEIAVDDFRPMKAAIDRIEELSGVPINYEDMPLYHSADLKDVTAEARTTPPAGVRLFAPRGGQLSVSIAVDATTGKLNDLQAVKDALLAVISAYNSSGLPGGFDFEEYNGVFFVKPVRYRDKTGATQTMKPLLSTPIILPEEKRDWSVTIRLILQQLSKASGSLVGLASGPMLDGDVTLGSNNEPADHVIARVLAAMACANGTKFIPFSITAQACEPVGAQTSWDVGYTYGLGYAPGYGYLLGINRVPNSRWFVPPPQKPLPRPTPRTGSPGDGAGGIRRKAPLKQQ